MNGKKARALRKESKHEKFLPIIRQYADGSASRANISSLTRDKIYKMLKRGYKEGLIIL